MNELSKINVVFKTFEDYIHVLLLPTKRLVLLSSSEDSEVIEMWFLWLDLVGFGFILIPLSWRELELFPEWATNELEVFDIDFLDDNKKLVKEVDVKEFLGTCKIFLSLSWLTFLLQKRKR